jgi:hypothetical protein
VYANKKLPTGQKGFCLIKLRPAIKITNNVIVNNAQQDNIIEPTGSSGLGFSILPFIIFIVGLLCKIM